MDDKKDMQTETYVHALTTNKDTCLRRTLDMRRISLVLCKYASLLEAEPELAPDKDDLAGGQLAQASNT